MAATPPDRRLLVQVYKAPDCACGDMALYFPDGTLVPGQVSTTISGGVGESTRITVEFVIDNRNIILCSLDEFEKITGKKCGSP